MEQKKNLILDFAKGRALEKQEQELADERKHELESIVSKRLEELEREEFAMLKEKFIGTMEKSSIRTPALIAYQKH